MKTSLALAFAFLLSASAMAADKVLEYTFGNQIKGSRLIIYANGSVQKQERSCCPPSTKQWPPFNADQASLDLIQEATLDLPTSMHSSFESGLSNPGSSAGSLYVFDSGANPILVRSIERGPDEMSPRIVKFSESTKAKNLEVLVERLVDVKIDY